jgi:RHS repeat-associated protein
MGPLVGTPPNQHAPPANSNPATYLYYDEWNLVQEGLSASVADRTYVHGGRVDEIVASEEGAGGPWYHHHYDAGGNCIMLTTGNGGLQEQYDYDAFGFPYFYTATGGKLLSVPHTRFLFTGREWLSGLRIYDYRARQYQPELGRFLQPDPKQFEARDYNLYRYCHNDPVNRTDSTGLDTDFGTVPQAILQLGIDAAFQSYQMSISNGDHLGWGLERGVSGLQSLGDSTKTSLSSANVAKGLPFMPPQRTDMIVPEQLLGQKRVVGGHNHPVPGDLSANDKEVADHSHIPVVMTSDGVTYRVYAPFVDTKGRPVNGGGVTQTVTRDGVHVFDRHSGKEGQ